MSRQILTRRVLRGDRGTATAELAVALPAVVILLLTGIFAIATITGRLGCLSTARDQALAAARGEQMSAKDGVTVNENADTVTVSIDRGAASCQAVAAREPGLP